MRVFVTGATGFIGTAIVQELIKGGHKVLGLARSEQSARKLIEAGAEVHRGDLEDLDSLRAGAAASDAVIHAGFIHEFNRFAEVCAVDKTAIETIGQMLVGSNRPLIVTSGSALVSPGQLATEHMAAPVNPAWPRASEEAAAAVAALGVRVATVRLSPSVHGNEDHHGFIPIMVNIAREKGVSAYVGEGLNRWNAVHRLDAALLYRLALEKVAAGNMGSEIAASGNPGTEKTASTDLASGEAASAVRFHACSEEAITVKAIAEAIGQQLNLPVVSISPEEAAGHFGWFAQMASIDCPASSKWTREQLDWTPTHPELLVDINGGVYTKQGS